MARPDLRLHEPPQGTPPTLNWVTGVRGGIPCRHKWGRPEGSFGPDANGVRYPLLIPIDKLKYVVPYILGFSDLGGPRGYFIRGHPIRDPDGLGMYAVAIPSYTYKGLTGVRTNTQQPELNNNLNDPMFGPNPVDRTWDLTQVVAKQYRYCQLNVEFRHIDWFICADQAAWSHPMGERVRYTYAYYNNSLEYNTLQRGSLQWGVDWQGVPRPGGAAKVGFGVGVPSPVGELVIEWYGVPIKAVSVFQSALWPAIVGRINATPLQVSMYGQIVTYAAGTLMLQPPRPKRRFQPYGSPSRDVEYRFSHRPTGWNFFLDPTAATPLYYSVHDAGGKVPFQTADFERLFRIV